MGTVYGQFCPVAVAAEVFAERWTPVILRELLLGSRRFNEIQRGVPRISRALLVKRLRELQAHGVLTSLGGEYRLTPAGEELGEVVVQLGRWGQRWTTPVQRDTLDARLLVWDMRRRIAVDRLPDRRLVRNGRRSTSASSSPASTSTSSSTRTSRRFRASGSARCRCARRFAKARSA